MNKKTANIQFTTVSEGFFLALSVWKNIRTIDYKRNLIIEFIMVVDRCCKKIVLSQT